MSAYYALDAGGVLSVQEYVRWGGGLMLGGHFWGSDGQYTNPGGRAVSAAAGLCC
jgi:hypothetical protein